MAVWALLILLIIGRDACVDGKLAATEERVRCLREELEMVNRTREILPLLIRTELRAHEERMRVLMEARDD